MRITFQSCGKKVEKIHKICIIGPKQDIDRIAEHFEEKSEIAQKNRMERAVVY